VSVEVSLNLTKANADPSMPCVLFTVTDDGSARNVACTELTIDEAVDRRDQLTALITCWESYG
jgi:hypothetical protein